MSGSQHLGIFPAGPCRTHSFTNLDKETFKIVLVWVFQGFLFADTLCSNLALSSVYEAVTTVEKEGKRSEP
jgi:hypothetical protein